LCQVKHLEDVSGVVRQLLFLPAIVNMTADLLIGLFVAYGYWIVFTAILLDNAGLPIPGELLLLTFGIIAKDGFFDPLLGLAVAATAALVGDSLGYWIGRLGGERVLARLGRRPRFTPGNVTMVFGRFVVGARVLLAPLAGVARMPFRRFLVFDAVGCLAWAGSFILVGYASGLSLDAIEHGVRMASTAGQGVVAAVLGAWLLARFVSRRRRRTVAA
jgi:membrane protein DedA with SNARE-associated domain